MTKATSFRPTIVDSSAEQCNANSWRRKEFTEQNKNKLKPEIQIQTQISKSTSNLNLNSNFKRANLVCKIILSLLANKEREDGKNCRRRRKRKKVTELEREMRLGSEFVCRLANARIESWPLATSLARIGASSSACFWSVFGRSSLCSRAQNFPTFQKSFVAMRRRIRNSAQMNLLLHAGKQSLFRRRFALKPRAIAMRQSSGLRHWSDQCDKAAERRLKLHKLCLIDWSFAQQLFWAYKGAWVCQWAVS